MDNFLIKNNTDYTTNGRYVKLNMVNPHNSRFIVKYKDSVVYGNNLIDTGWDSLKDGIVSLEYVLSTGHVIKIPKFKSYLSMIDCSQGVDGSRVFNSITVYCISDFDTNKCIIYKIILKEHSKSKFKIGDIIINESNLAVKSSQWKLGVF